MIRRKFISKGAALTAAASLATVLPGNLAARQKKQPKTQLVHYVLFWLKPDLSESELASFSGFFEDLKKIPAIKSLRYGRAAGTPKRDVVDNSFSYSMIAIFDTIESHNDYQTDPAHLAAVKKYSKNWNKVVVHDTLMDA